MENTSYQILKKLRIKGFQAHDDLTIELDQITTIIGPSDVGKSSIIRSLQWCLLNKPRGSQFIKHGCNSCSVTLWIDGFRIRRSKGKSNLYKLNNRTFCSFSNDVPEDIKRIVRVSRINFQLQHDPPFWLSLSPSDLARELNKIVDMTDADKCYSYLSKSLRRAKIEHDLANQEQEINKKKLDELSDILVIVSMRDSILIVSKELEKETIIIENLGGLIGEISRVEEQINHVPINMIDGFTKAYRQLVKDGDEMENMNNLIYSINNVSSKIKPINYDDIGILTDAVEETTNTNRKITYLRLTLEEMERISCSLTTHENDLIQLNRQLKKEMKGRCPICGKEIKT